MTIELAREVITDEIKALQGGGCCGLEEPELLAAALQMALEGFRHWQDSLDIEYDYNAQAKQLRDMILYYKTEARPVKQADGWHCPGCGKFTNESHDHCHICGKRLGWKQQNSRQKSRKGKK